MPLLAPAGYLYWYTTSVILFILTLFNIIFKVYNHYSIISRPTELTALPISRRTLKSSHSDPTASSLYAKSRVEEATCYDQRRSIPYRLARVVITGYNRYFGLTSVTLPGICVCSTKKWIGISSEELAWTVGYAVGVMLLSFWGSSFQVGIYSNQAAWIAVAQIPLIIALAGKNNLVSWLTGISYEKLNFLHRAAGRVCLVCVWIHSAGHLYINRGLNHVTWKVAFIQWGVIGLISYTLLTTASLRWMRKRFYEAFLLSHILLVVVTLVAFVLHWNAVGVWIYPGVGIWAADRLSRLVRVIVSNHFSVLLPTKTTMETPSSATLTSLSPSTILITFPSPSKYMTWGAGQHFYILMPGLTTLPWEAHPFTAASVPKADDRGELCFVVRVRNGFTRNLKERLDRERRIRGMGSEDEVSVQVKGAVEGPYGERRDVNGHEAVLLVAGGSGISFAVSHLLGVIREAKAGRSRVRTIRLIWMLKSKLHLNWIRPILDDELKDIPSNLKLQLDLYVTKHQMATLQSSSPSPSSILDLQEQLATSSAGFPKRSRLMSNMSWVTWTDSSDRLSSSVPETRRGSMAVIPSEVGKLRPAKKLPTSSATDWGRVAEAGKEEKDLPVVNVLSFDWSEGYGVGSRMPSVTPDDFVGEPSVQRRRLSSYVSPDFRGLDVKAVEIPDHRQEMKHSYPPVAISHPPSARKISINEPEIKRDGNSISRKSSPAIISGRGSNGTLLSVSMQPSSEYGRSYTPASMSRTSSARSDGSITSTALLLPQTSGSSRYGDVGQMMSYQGESASVSVPRKMGLERYVKWHEGRADLTAVVRAMMDTAGRGGRLSVNACGPKSLLDSTREAVREVSSVDGALKGEAVVDLHLETFGW